MLRKLLMIVFGIALVLSAGSCNIYPLYLNKMMDKFGYTLKEANLYGSFINLGLWVAFTMGMIYDKFGPKISCILGAVLISGSFAVLHIIMNSDSTSLNIIPMLIIALVMGQGSALCYTTAVTTNLKNFQSNNSAIVGLLVSNMAISPSIFTTYRQALPNEQKPNYFLILSVFLGIVVLVCGWVFTNIKNLYSQHEKLKEYEQYKEKKIIRLLVILNLLILVVYTFGVIFNNLNSDNRFPNVIIYPCLQSLNFLFVIFELLGFWEKLYFREFIEKEIRRKLKLEEDNDIKNTVKNYSSHNSVTPVETPNSNNNNLNFPAIPLVEDNSSINQNENINNSNINPHDDNPVEECKRSDIIEENKPTPMPLAIVNPQETESKVINYNNNKYPKRKNSFDMSGSKIKYTSVLDFGLKNENFKEPPAYHNTSYGGDLNRVKKMFEMEMNNKDNKNIQIINSEIKLEKREGYIEDDSNVPSDNTNQLEAIPELPNLTENLHNRSEFSKFLFLISTKEILLLFTILILGVGSAIANLNNIQFIISSVSKSPTSKEIYDYAVLYFVFNSFFRILSGLIIDKLIEKKKTFYFLIFTSIIGLISQLLGISMDKDLLFISVALVGAAHGGYMTFTPIYTRQFGLENMGKVLGFLTTGCAIGSILIADFIFTFFFDLNKVEEKCLGKKCFSDAYIISSVFFGVNIVLSSALLHINNKKIK